MKFFNDGSFKKQCMSETATHSIGKLSFHLKGVKTEKVFAMRQQVSDYLQHAFARMAEDVFDEFVLDDELLFVPRLSLELKLSADSFDLKKEEFRLREQMREQIAEQISLQRSTASVQHLQENEQKDPSFSTDANLLLQAWAYYLQHGYVPSYIPLTLWQQRLMWWGKSNLHATKELKEFFILQLNDGQRLKRLLKYAAADEQQWVFDQLHPQLNSILQEGKLKFGKPVPLSVYETKIYLLYLMSEDNQRLLQKEEQLPMIEWVIQQQEQHHYRQIKQIPADATRSPEQKNHLQQSEDEKAIIIYNAGIVLLQPFISTLFHELKLLSEDRKQLFGKDRACALLSFLAGDDEQAEVCFPLYKVLCGMQVHEVVDASVQLTNEEKEECFHLLQQVILHWSALKQTTVSSMQQTFLQRTGKLSHKEDKWLLQVEQRTEDVLLQYLPWSYSIIRYPWMKQALFVEWT